MGKWAHGARAIEIKCGVVCFRGGWRVVPDICELTFSGGGNERKNRFRDAVTKELHLQEKDSKGATFDDYLGTT